MPTSRARGDGCRFGGHGRFAEGLALAVDRADRIHERQTFERFLNDRAIAHDQDRHLLRCDILPGNSIDLGLVDRFDTGLIVEELIIGQVVVDRGSPPGRRRRRLSRIDGGNPG